MVRMFVCVALVGGILPAGALGSDFSAADATKQLRLAQSLLRVADPGVMRTLEAPDFADLIPVSPGVTDGQFASDDTHHVYTIVLTAEQRLTVSLSAADDTNFDLYLYRQPDSLGVVGASWLDTYPERIVHDVRAPHAGTYYIVVERFSGAGDYALDVSVNSAPARSAINAIPGISLPMPSVAGQLDRGTEPDHVYSVHLDAGERLSVVLDAVGGDADVFVFGPGATDVTVDRPVAGAATRFSPEMLAFDVPVGAGGTYYVNVWAASGSPAYELAASVAPTPVPGADAEIPGSAALASPLVDSLDGAGDSMVYALPAAVAGDRITLSLSGAEGTDFDIRLFAPGSVSVGGVPVARSEFPTYPEEIVYTVPDGAAGTYYAQVRGYRGSGAYALAWSVGPRGYATVGRLAGSNRYLTAVEISSRTFAAGSCDTVVLATGADYPDALAASGLAGAYGAPVLLTMRNTLSTPVRTEMSRLGAKHVLVVGGPVAISEQVTNALTEAGFTWRRIDGPDRMATAVAVAEETVAELARAGRPWDGTAFLARSDGFADALAAAPIAYGRGVPILLTRPGSLSSVTAAGMKSLGVEDVVVVGGEAAITPATYQAAAAADGVKRIDRVWGVTRYETAAQLADYALKFHWATSGLVGVATGLDFADALSGGAAAGAGGGVLLLTTTSRLPQPSGEFFSAQSGAIRSVSVYGGASAVAESVISEIADIAP